MLSCYVGQQVHLPKRPKNDIQLLMTILIGLWSNRCRLLLVVVGLFPWSLETGDVIGSCVSGCYVDRTRCEWVAVVKVVDRMHGMACMYSPYVDSIDRSITPMISGKFTGARHVNEHVTCTSSHTSSVFSRSYYSVWSSIGVIMSSVCLWLCALLLSALVYRAKSCISLFLAGKFLFVPLDTFAVGCIV